MGKKSKFHEQVDSTHKQENNGEHVQLLPEQVQLDYFLHQTIIAREIRLAESVMINISLRKKVTIPRFKYILRSGLAVCSPAESRIVFDENYAANHTAITYLHRLQRGQLVSGKFYVLRALPNMSIFHADSLFHITGSCLEYLLSKNILVLDFANNWVVPDSMTELGYRTVISAFSGRGYGIWLYKMRAKHITE